jgi:hypothetical protein
MVPETGPKAVLEFAKHNNAQILDLRFTDLPGLWHHVSFPIGQLTEESFEEGFGMDGSSIRGWAAIHESDMLLIPDPSRYVIDPFTEVPTLVMVCDVIDPVTKQRYDRDPRYIAKKAEIYSLLPELLTRRISERRQNFSSSIMFASTRTSMKGTTSSMPRRAAGIRDASQGIWAIGHGTRRGISPFLRQTTIKTCALTWCWPCRAAGSR